MAAGEPADAQVRLEDKLVAFAASLPEDEQMIFHDIVHLAMHNDEVEGFMVRSGQTNADPCEGGEVTDLRTFTVLGNLHGMLHPIKLPTTPR